MPGAVSARDDEDRKPCDPWLASAVAADIAGEDVAFEGKSPLTSARAVSRGIG